MMTPLCYGRSSNQSADDGCMVPANCSKDTPLIRTLTMVPATCGWRCVHTKQTLAVITTPFSLIRTLSALPSVFAIESFLMLCIIILYALGTEVFDLHFLLSP